MSVQVSTRIDEATKQQFDKVCENIGISSSNALSMFIKSVINHNGIPFKAVVPPEKSSKTPREETFGCMREQLKTTDESSKTVRPPFEYVSMSEKLPFGRGCMKGKMWMADDFDAPLEDFKEYME